MNRLKIEVETLEQKSKKIIEASKHFEKIDNKQIVGHSRVKHPNQPAVNLYVLEDGTEVMEDDEGKAVTKWPEPVRNKKAVEAELLESKA